jgi:hypothetical protein
MIRAIEDKLMIAYQNHFVMLENMHIDFFLVDEGAVGTVKIPQDKGCCNLFNSGVIA